VIGAIVGDVIGSVYEFGGIRTTEFPLFVPASRFTDDSVMTIATADALLSGTPYAQAYRAWARRYPNAGYGAAFHRWFLQNDAGPYNSWGNGSAMRVSPVAFVAGSVEEVLAEAKRSASVTHDHPEGIIGAQAAALAVYLARTGVSKPEIRVTISSRFGYDLSRTIDEIRPGYSWDVSCQGSVPEALVAFLETADLESAVRAAISLGGDSDTQAAIAGAAAAAFDGRVPDEIDREIRRRLPSDMRDVLERFEARYC
jgi:ADP-ribosylglycohydrolase